MFALTTVSLLVATGMRLLGASGLIHEGIHERIEKATKHIEDRPGDVRLYLARAELYRTHQDWPEAEADLKVVKRSGSHRQDLLLAEARLFLDRGLALQAINNLQAYNQAQAQNPEAWQLLAHAWLKLNRPAKSAEAMGKAISLFPTVEPDHFHFRAKALQQIGKNGLQEALLCVEDGLKKLGACISLELLAIELQSKLGSLEAAQARLDRLSQNAKRKESWFIRKGDVYWQNGRRGEARTQYQAALHAIKALKPRTRSTRAVQKMLSHAKSRLAS